MLICAPFLMQAQNLVPNPGFENYRELPCDLNAYPLQTVLQDWFQPLITTTDYWNTDAVMGCEMNPASVGESPRTGNGLIGIIIADVLNNAGKLKRFKYQEYAAIKLQSPLQEQKFYYAEYYARVKSREFASNAPIVRSNHLGMAFTDSLIYRTSIFDTARMISLNAQVESQEAIDAEWKKVSGCFLADKSADYMYIGNFKNINQAKIEGNLPIGKEGYAYYFIDDVLVEQLHYDLSAIPKDLTFCDERGLGELNASVGGALGYLWDDGSTSPFRKVPVADNTQYFVDIQFSECTFRHTFNLKNIPGIELGVDSTLCAGETILLSNQVVGSDIIWSDGSTDSVKLVTTSGTYTAKTNDADCVLEDAVDIKFIECPGFLPNVITPNEDNYNQRLIFENIGNRSWSLEVFNNWGQEVYTAANYKNDWDGNNLPDGVYYYKLSSDQLKKEVKGWIKIIN
ncbi:MAG: gliding motility-associated C-terminal domain-containing protein [Chryseolinea sp.]